MHQLLRSPTGPLKCSYQLNRTVPSCYLRRISHGLGTKHSKDVPSQRPFLLERGIFKTSPRHQTAVNVAAEELDQFEVEEDPMSIDGYSSTGHVGPAFAATLNMLEWHRVCEHVASFASTMAGKQACMRLTVPETQEESQELMRLTRAATVLEYDFATILDFGGINTGEGERGIRRADKAALCTASQLRAVASIIEGGDKIKKQILVAARENDAVGRNSPLAPLMPWVNRLKPQPATVRTIRAAIDDENNVLDSASENLRSCRQRVKQLQGKLSNLLKGYGGEVSEKGGRICVALPAGTKLPPASMLLGSSQGGGIVFVEPPAAVATNNELAAARGEAYAAEEAVLYNLTSTLMGIVDEVRETYRSIVFFDVLASKVRYGLWMKGVLPTFVPWNRIFQERSGQATRRRQQGFGNAEDDSDDVSNTIAEEDGGGWSNTGVLAEDAAARLAANTRYAVRLRGLRHPLLMGDYLKERDRLERELRRAGLDPLAVANGTATAATLRRSGSAKGSGGSRRDNMLRELSDDMAAGGGRGKKKDLGAAALQAIEEYKALKPPVPIDLSMKPHTSVVVITGPNTGGKTATMKAFGLTAMMARCGLPIPCDSPALLPSFSNVLADIGDEQSLTANLSTFSGHLTRIQGLRAEADGRSLVLLDELGTGTDPVEGAALGVALLRRMVQGGLGGGALTIATTHHSIMTGLKFDDAQGRFENASVEFDQVALAPTYRLLWGIPGKSNALNIASRLGLDSDVVEAARARLDVSVATADDAVTELEKLQKQLSDEEVAKWAVDQRVQALQVALKAVDTEAKALQQQLIEAKEQALYEVYLAAKERLRNLRASKRVKGVKMPARAPAAAVAAAAAEDTQQHPQEGVDDETQQEVDVRQELQQLAAQIVGRSDNKKDRSKSRSSTTSSTGLTLEELADSKLDMSDLLDDLSAKQQQLDEMARIRDEQYDRAVASFESLASQIPIDNSGSDASGSETAADDEYASWISYFEEQSGTDEPSQKATAAASAPSAAVKQVSGSQQQSQQSFVDPEQEDEYDVLAAQLELLDLDALPISEPTTSSSAADEDSITHDDMDNLVGTHELETVPHTQAVDDVSSGTTGQEDVLDELELMISKLEVQPAATPSGKAVNANVSTKSVQPQQAQQAKQQAQQVRRREEDSWMDFLEFNVDGVDMQVVDLGTKIQSRALDSVGATNAGVQTGQRGANAMNGGIQALFDDVQTNDRNVNSNDDVDELESLIAQLEDVPMTVPTTTGPSQGAVGGVRNSKSNNKERRRR